MKKIICLLLAVFILLSGCSFANGNIKEPVEFYYPRSCSRPDEYKTFFSEGAIASEIREASGRRNDLYYLLSMYLRGPLDPNLHSPFPPGSAVVKVQQNDRELSVYLNAVAANLEAMDLTVACSCLAQTCMALADVDAVYIEAQNIDDKVLFSTTLSRGSLLLEESPPPSTISSEGTQ